MIKFERADFYPLSLLDSWLRKDKWHQDSRLDYWKVDGKEILACWIRDSVGPIMYLKLDTERRNVRMHVQFAPDIEVSRIRVAKAILAAWPRITAMTNIPDVEGIAFESKNPELVAFMLRLGFKIWKNDDYLYSFRES